MKEKQYMLDVQNLTVEYNMSRNRKTRAVSSVEFQIREGETLGLVGESGCGKSTAALAIMRLINPVAGKILFDGHDLLSLDKKSLKKLRPLFQMILQDSVSSLNPRRKIGETIAAPLKEFEEKDSAERKKLAVKIMEAVGVDPEKIDLLPFRFSGGECQRIQIARALITKPKLLIADEPVSSLDVSIQAQILNLLKDMKRRFGLTMLFISHDLAVIKNICDRVAVMYLGKICEIADSADLYDSPAHPYTAALLKAVPRFDSVKNTFEPAASLRVKPSPPSLFDSPEGCRFRMRCPEAVDICARREPLLNRIAPSRYAACHARCPHNM